MESKVILLILNCKKYSYKRKKQIESWIPCIKDKIRYFHVIGEEDLEEDYKFDRTEKILYVKCKDDYLSLPTKTILSIMAINETYDDFEYIFKSDDDQNVSQSFWSNFIFDKINKKVHYGGKKVHLKKNQKVCPGWRREHPEVPQDHILEKTIYCGGRFYILSKEASKNILEKKEKFKEKIVEDHSVGLYLDEKYKKNGLYFNIDKFFRTKF